MTRCTGRTSWTAPPAASAGSRNRSAARTSTGCARCAARRRQACPVAAGEHLWTPEEAQRLLAAEAVDVIQADATRCLGLTGYRAIGALAAARGLSLSAHCAPALHAHAACSVQRSARLEYFHDHVRLERRLFEGAPEPDGGVLTVDRTRPGHGLSVRVSRACP
jgi:L-rhamnonate dehydratase